MNGHPSGRDSKGDAAVARVNAIRAARGLAPVVDRNPDDVRADLMADRDSMMVAVAVLHRPGCGATVPDTIDEVLAGKPTAAAFDLPPGVAYAILRRTPDDLAPAVFDALDAELGRFAAKCASAPAGVRGLAHLAVHRLHGATHTAIVDDIAAGLPACGTVVDGTAITAEMRAQIAEHAAGIAITGIVDRLRAELYTLAGLP